MPPSNARCWPAPTSRDRITALLAERAPAYRRFDQVDTEARTPAEVVDEILTQLAGRRA